MSEPCLGCAAPLAPSELQRGFCGYCASNGRGRVLLAVRYSRAEIQANRDRLYVFGDNMTTLGRGGQAKECRGEPNTVGIVTKWYPSNEPSSFFCDADLEKVRWSIQASFRRLAAHLEAGGDVVWPSDGVGTGLARLKERAPAVAAFIERCRCHLVNGTRDRDEAPTGLRPERAQGEAGQPGAEGNRPNSITTQLD